MKAVKVCLCCFYSSVLRCLCFLVKNASARKYTWTGLHVPGELEECDLAIKTFCFELDYHVILVVCDREGSIPQDCAGKPLTIHSGIGDGCHGLTTMLC